MEFYLIDVQNFNPFANVGAHVCQSTQEWLAAHKAHHLYACETGSYVSIALDLPLINHGWPDDGYLSLKILMVRTEKWLSC